MAPVIFSQLALQAPINPVYTLVIPINQLNCSHAVEQAARQPRGSTPSERWSSGSRLLGDSQLRTCM
jgi:hypothetical protein